MSEETTAHPAILASVGEVMDEVRSISKSGRMEVRGGPNYNFRKADDVVNELGEAFRKFSIMPQSRVLNIETESYETTKHDEKWGDKITHWHRSIITVRYTFTSLIDGSTLVGEGVGEGLDSGDKSVPKAMTGAMKSAFTQVYAIAFKDMADPDNERPEYQDETETDAQRILRERREAQAQAAGQPTKAYVDGNQAGVAPQQATMTTGSNGVTEPTAAKLDDQQAQTQAVHEAREKVNGDPMAAGVETLKTELGAREIGQEQDTPEWREQRAN
ncbi:MAG TPA: ERF family protein, partial [Pseudonocardia sp.]